MKKIILTLALAAFTFGVTAGSDCCPGKSGDKKECPEKKEECPAKAGKCPAGGDQKKDEAKS